MTHQYPKYVFHEEFGNGELINGMHDQPAEDGSVSWFDVMFEHGIEQRVSIDDLYEGAFSSRALKPSDAMIDKMNSIESHSTVRGKDEKGTYTAKLHRPAGSSKHKELSRVYDAAESVDEEVELDEDAPKGRGRPPKPGSEAAKRQAEAGGQSEEAVGLEAQLLKHKDLYGQRTGPIKFADGSTHDISSGHREKALQKIRELRGAGTNPDTRDKTAASMHSSHNKFLQHIGAKPTPKKEYHPMAINKEEVQGITRLKNGTFLAVNESGEALTFKSQSLAIQFVGEKIKAMCEEEVEGLDEMGRKKLLSYRQDNENDRIRLSRKIGIIKGDKMTPDQEKDDKKLSSRIASDELALSKLYPKGPKGEAKVKATESTELDEVSFEKAQAVQAGRTDQKNSVYVESNRFRGVENSIRSVMENNTNLRKLAEVAKWKKNNPE
jgi:hypothetical protein